MSFQVGSGSFGGTLYPSANYGTVPNGLASSYSGSFNICQRLGQ